MADKRWLEEDPDSGFDFDENEEGMSFPIEVMKTGCFFPIAISLGIISRINSGVKESVGYFANCRLFRHRHISERQAKRYSRDMLGYKRDQETGSLLFADPSETRVGRKVAECDVCEQRYKIASREIVCRRS